MGGGFLGRSHWFYLDYDPSTCLIGKKPATDHNEGGKGNSFPFVIVLEDEIAGDWQGWQLTGEGIINLTTSRRHDGKFGFHGYMVVSEQFRLQ
jgi:hypothetical protein